MDRFWIDKPFRLALPDPVVFGSDRTAVAKHISFNQDKSEVEIDFLTRVEPYWRTYCLPIFANVSTVSDAFAGFCDAYATALDRKISEAHNRSVLEQDSRKWNQRWNALRHRRLTQWHSRPEDWTYESWERLGGASIQEYRNGKFLYLSPGVALHKGGAPQILIAIHNETRNAIWIPGHPTLTMDLTLVAFDN